MERRENAGIVERGIERADDMTEAIDDETDGEGGELEGEARRGGEGGGREVERWDSSTEKSEFQSRPTPSLNSQPPSIPAPTPVKYRVTCEGLVARKAAGETAGHCRTSNVRFICSKWKIGECRTITPTEGPHPPITPSTDHCNPPLSQVDLQHLFGQSRWPNLPMTSASPNCEARDETLNSSPD